MPSVAFPNCLYTRNNLFLNGHSCFAGLPDFVQTFTDVTTAVVVDAVCLKDTSFLIPDHIGAFASTYVVDWKDGSVDTYSAPFSAKSFSHLYAQAGNYPLSLFINYSCYTDTFFLSVKVNPLPQFTLGPDTSLCEGYSLPLVVSAGFDSYLWSDGSSSPNTIVDAGTIVALSTTLNSCSFSDTLAVRMLPNPLLNIDLLMPLCPDYNIDALLSASKNDHYLWSTGDTSKVIAVNSPGWVKLTCVTDSGCVQNDSVLIEDACPFLIFFPSAITPDGDGLNDYFIPYGDVPENYNLSIYNRWNQLVFKRDSDNNKWDANNITEGVYSFVFSCSDLLGNNYRHHGVFTVVY